MLPLEHSCSVFDCNGELWQAGSEKSTVRTSVFYWGNEMKSSDPRGSVCQTRPVALMAKSKAEDSAGEHKKPFSCHCVWETINPYFAIEVCWWEAVERHIRAIGVQKEKYMLNRKKKKRKLCFCEMVKWGAVSWTGWEHRRAFPPSVSVQIFPLATGAWIWLTTILKRQQYHFFGSTLHSVWPETEESLHLLRRKVIEGRHVQNPNSSHVW